MGRTNQPSTMTAQITALRKELAALRKRVGANDALAPGTLFVRGDRAVSVVVDGDGEVLYLGPDQTGKQTVRIRREGVPDVVYVATLTDDQPRWTLADPAGTASPPDAGRPDDTGAG